MRGHIVKRARHSWSIVVPLGRDPANGKRRQQWVSIRDTKKDAERQLAQLINHVESGLPIDKGRLNVREYMETWLRDIVSVRNRPSTRRSYATIVRRHINPVLGHMPLIKLQPADVERLESGLLADGKSSSTAHHVHVVLSKAIKDAMRKGLVHQNVCQSVDPPKVGRYEVQVPDIEAIRRILDLAENTPYAAVFKFMAYTGVRRGEAVALRWRNVDLDTGVVSIVETAQRFKDQGIVFQMTKSAAGRRGIAIDAATIELLRDHRGLQLLNQVELQGSYEDNDLVFPGPLGKPLDPSVLTRNFQALALRIRVHGPPSPRPSARPCRGASPRRRASKGCPRTPWPCLSGIYDAGVRARVARIAGGGS